MLVLIFLTYIYIFFYSFRLRDSGRIKLLLMFCSGTYNLVLGGWLRFGLLYSLGLGIERDISISDNFLIFFLKMKLFPWRIDKRSLFHWFNFQIFPNQYILDRYLDNTFFPLFDFHFLLEHICYCAGFFGFLSSPSRSTKNISLSTFIPFQVNEATVCNACFYEELNYYNYPEKELFSTELQYQS